MAKPRIMQTMHYDSRGTQVCSCQRSQRNSKGITPNRGPK